ncbi:MAG: SNF2 helicase associated domain-containing protein [Verrucomicrobiales bacterium]|nr:SNF2 helicase associated domain-containing protein [Verrucomicrobiales bacterium]
MPDLVLSDKLLAGLAGWEVVKQARTIVAENRVLSSSWEPPLLRGVVQSGTTSYRAGLAIRRENDAENLCTCRQSREWGTLCPHSIAVGLHYLKPTPPPAPTPSSAPQAPPSRSSPRPNSPPAAPTRDVRRLTRATAESPGEPLELHIVFPPNLGDGLARGKATLFIEGTWRKRSLPLTSLPLDQAFQLSPQDAALLDALELLAGGDSPSMLALGPADLVTLLDLLAGHPRLTFGKTRAVTVDPTPWRAPLRARLQENGEILLQLKPLPKPPVFIPGATPWLLLDSTFQPLRLPPGALPALGGPLRIPRAQVPTFVSASLPELERATDWEADFTATSFEVVQQAPRFHLHLAGGLARLTARLSWAYGARLFQAGALPTAESAWQPDPSHPRRYLGRDLAAEAAALERLRRAGFHGPLAQGEFDLAGQNPVLTFFARDYQRLQKEWTVELEERLERSTQQNLEHIEPRIAISSSGVQWFDVQVSYAGSQGTSLPAAEVQRLLRGGQPFTRLKNGKFALLDTGAVEELEQILVDTAPEQHAGAYRMNQAQAGFMDASLRALGHEPAAPPAWRQHARQMSGAVPLECPPLGPLQDILRPYQRLGVAWMLFLRQNRFGGILADEMGLGKTLQTLALLQHTRTHAAAADRAPCLVVCPTSLVSNWELEARRFTPNLRSLVLDGPQRHARFEELRRHDLVITSYALLRRDLDRYRGIEFDTVVLDEAQHIKNRQTQNAQAVKTIRARHRLVLTGTPMENSVLDLWSIFDFLMPGYLGAAQDFRERYEVPITRERDAASQQRLARRIRPFLLRRLKRDVAPELPARIDQVVWCDLTENQARTYQQLLDATRREVLEAVGAQGLAKSRMLVLTALLRLRQVCCDLRLLGLESTPDASSAPAAAPNAAADDDADASAKVTAFSELLEEVLDGNHRVLVFSQFTRMLGLLRESLDQAGVRYCYLDGSTTARGEEVARFQNTADIPVFLISLKAGGVGLNLTAADTVIHFDPWWNPAVEDQATDRAHRIGQNRVVTSYKLVTRGTVEEKIVELQNRKRDVLRGLLTDEEQLSTSLSWDEIQSLLA